MSGKIALVALALVLAVWAGAESATVKKYGAHNYRAALTKSILFFEGQRSGKLPFNQRMKWRGDSGLSDGAAEHVDLTGGYYDAGDNVKFGLPMAFTITMLSWSVLEFGGRMGDDLQHARNAIRWGADYLLKATAHPGTIYVQVGDPNMDHKCWERPEDMDTPRSVYKIDAQNPGSDVASETAAALAAASMVFTSRDSFYSQLLLQTAVQVFEFADTHRGVYSDSLQYSPVCPFYCSYSGYRDELLWGAAWLAKATRNESYVNYIQSNGQALGSHDNVNVLSWDQKHAGTRILLAREVLINKVKYFEEYRDLANNYICSLLPASARYSPGGLLFNGGSDQSNLQYVTSATFLLFTYAKYLSVSKQVVRCNEILLTPTTIRTLAKIQVDYILGDNPLGMSYMVGYGAKFPQHIHHRGSSLPSIYDHPQTISCKDGFNLGLYGNGPNPNILVGAVVGGPDNNDQFRDERSDYSHLEPTTYINAPLVGSLAYLAGS